MARIHHSDEELPIVPLLAQISERASNCLRNHNFETIEQVQQTPDAELLEITNFGKICLAEVRALAPYRGPKPAPEIRIRRIIARIKSAQGMLRNLQEEIEGLQAWADEINKEG